MRNVIMMVNLAEELKPSRNRPYKYSMESWRRYAERYGHELLILDERIHRESYMNANWHKVYALELVMQQGYEFDKVLIVDSDTIIHPDAPDIFTVTGDEFTAVHNSGSYDWLFRSMEVYSAKWFESKMFDFELYFNSGVMIVNKSHCDVFRRTLEFYHENQVELVDFQRKYGVGTDQPVLNFMVHLSDIPFKLLPYSWNMQDMCRREILTPDLLFTKFGWLYHFNAIPDTYKIRSNDAASAATQWMEYTYTNLFGA